MEYVPHMPDDWWPELIVIRGREMKGETALEISVAMSAEDAREPMLMSSRLKDMRFALWQAKHLDRS